MMGFSQEVTEKIYLNRNLRLSLHFELIFQEYGLGIAIHKAFGIVIIIDLTTEFLKKGNIPERIF